MHPDDDPFYFRTLHQTFESVRYDIKKLQLRLKSQKRRKESKI